MSEFHENIRSFMEDALFFIQDTLNNEVLSPTANSSKNHLLRKLIKLSNNYPQLQLSVTSKNAGSSSPQPYIDMTSNKTDESKTSLVEESYYYDVAEEDAEYEIVNPVSEAKPEAKTTVEIDDKKSISIIPASELINPLKCGYLDKKGKERLGGLINAFQKRWCIIKDGIFFYYERPTDKRQKGQIDLVDYVALPLTEISSKDTNSKACFELTCPGRKTYQFNALSIKDMKQWIAAIEQSQTTSKVRITQVEITDLELKSSEEDLYESLENNSPLPMQSQSSIGSLEPDYDEGLSLVTSTEDEDLYADAESMLSQVMEISHQFHANSNQNVEKTTPEVVNADQKTASKVVYVEGEGHVIDPSSWFICMWDCKGSTSNELDLKRGDLVKVVSKQYDDYSWWIGELAGKIGLIPKNYITEAYEKVR